MMRGELLCWDGRRIRLPDAVEWRFQYGCGTPCDSFFLSCMWEPDRAEELADAVRFGAEQDGERVFSGVVDEIDLQNSVVRVTVSMMGKDVPVELELDQIEPLD